MDSWWEQAACKDADPELFFQDQPRGRPSKGYKDLPDVIWDFCATCPVQTDCLNDAMKLSTLDRVQTTFGIWGGTTQSMRRSMLKRRSNSSLRQTNN
jgi:WhiB family transcriptional regulator, redox-sensing transcriptional regulator